MAQGFKSQALADDAIALGTKATVEQGKPGIQTLGGIAIGQAATVKAHAEGAIAFGYESEASKKYASAIGIKAVATHEKAVALGAEATTKDFADVDNATVGKYIYGNFAGTPVAVVSVGKQGAERQLVNVAAGNIAQDSTDAINGSQLYATNNILGNVADTIVSNFGGDATTEKTGANAGKITFSDIGTTGESTIHEAIKKVYAESKKHSSVVEGENVASVDSTKHNDVGGIEYKVNVQDMRIKSGTAKYNDAGEGTITVEHKTGDDAIISGLKNTYVKSGTVAYKDGAGTLTLKTNDNQDV